VRVRLRDFEIVAKDGVELYFQAGDSGALAFALFDLGEELFAVAAEVAELIEFLRSRGLDCDFEPTGRIVMALTPGQLEEARRTIESAAGLGLSSFRFLDREAAQAELHSPLYQGGVAVSGGGILDPVKLVDALRQGGELLLRLRAQQRGHEQ